MLDGEHEGLHQDMYDPNTYTLGNIGRFNIFIACLPLDIRGTNDAANVATHMMGSFTSLRWLLIVGIGGGVPRSGIDLRLGDIVVGSQVIQHDFGKDTQAGEVKPTAAAKDPRRELAGAASSLRAQHDLRGSTIPSILQGMHEKWPIMKNYSHPDSSKDRLFCSNYNHKGTTPDCADCDDAMIENRCP